MQNFNQRRRPPNFPYDAIGFGGSHTQSVQPDETQFSKLRRAMVNGMVPFDCVVELLQTKNSPPQVRQNIYHADLAAVNAPVLLIPTNSKRLGFLVSNPTSNPIFFSYDYPYNSVSGTPVGIPIGDLSYFLESNGLASVNDIYVWSAGDGDDFTPFTIIGYEAVVTITPDNVV